MSLYHKIKGRTMNDASSRTRRKANIQLIFTGPVSHTISFISWLFLFSSINRRIECSSKQQWGQRTLFCVCKQLKNKNSGDKIDVLCKYIAPCWILLTTEWAIGKLLWARKKFITLFTRILKKSDWNSSCEACYSLCWMALFVGIHSVNLDNGLLLFF